MAPIRVAVIALCVAGLGSGGLSGATPAGATTSRAAATISLQPIYHVGEQYAYHVALTHVQTNFIPGYTLVQMTTQCTGTVTFTVSAVTAAGVATARMALHLRETFSTRKAPAPTNLPTGAIPWGKAQVQTVRDTAAHTVRLWPNGKAVDVPTASGQTVDLAAAADYQLSTGGPLSTRRYASGASWAVTFPSFEEVPGLPYDHPARIPPLTIHNKLTLGTAPTGEAIATLRSTMAMNVLVHAHTQGNPVTTRDVETTQNDQAINLNTHRLLAGHQTGSDVMIALITLKKGVVGLRVDETWEESITPLS